MLTEFRKKPFRYAFGAAVVVMGGLTTLKAFVTGTWPWMVESAAPFVGWLADWLPIIVAGVGFGFGLYWWLRSSTYRVTARKIIRDYYAEVGRLEAELDPVGHQRPSARLHSGHADPDWAGPIYDYYGVPREEWYGD